MVLDNNFTSLSSSIYLPLIHLWGLKVNSETCCLRAWSLYYFLTPVPFSLKAKLHCESTLHCVALPTLSIKCPMYIYIYILYFFIWGIWHVLSLTNLPPKESWKILSDSAPYPVMDRCLCCPWERHLWNLFIFTCLWISVLAFQLNVGYPKPWGHQLTATQK